MCGLAGFTRPDDAPGLDTAKEVAYSLMKRAESRGKHATGVAVLSQSDPFIRKWALSMKQVIATGLYDREIQTLIPDDVRFFIGHTRHATLPNKTDPSAAQPFSMDHVVGCHNGSIANWQELARDNAQEGWVSDSQAAMWALDSNDRPADSLKLLDGWWALTWVKQGSLHMTRTEERPLTVAYVRKMKTLFWGSLGTDVVEVMKDYKLKADIWELTADTVYSFDPKRFTKHSTKVQKEKVKLDRPSKKFARPKDVIQTDLLRKAGSGKRTWVDDVADKAKREPRTLAAQLQAMHAKIADMEGKLESQSAEIAYLFDLVTEAGLLDGEAQCVECNETGGEMLDLPDDEHIHAACVMAGE